MKEILKEAQLELEAEKQVASIVSKLAHKQHHYGLRHYLGPAVGAGLTTSFLLGATSNWLPFRGHHSLRNRLLVALALGSGVAGINILGNYLSRKIEKKPV